MPFWSKSSNETYILHRGMCERGMFDVKTVEKQRRRQRRWMNVQNNRSIIAKERQNSTDVHWNMWECWERDREGMEIQTHTHSSTVCVDGRIAKWGQFTFCKYSAQLLEHFQR